ncbi:MAG: geranylgeranyl reductase family protein [Cyanobacteria bacterium J06634_6]
MSLFDCIVVGAGPAGASAAYHLSKRGRSVLLLEKASLPRYKPCGGGVSPQVAQWFDFSFEPVISQKVTHARHTWKRGDAIDVELKSPMWMVRRDEFDHYLVQQAQKMGTQLRDETKATGVEWANDCWQVRTSEGDIWEGTYLIAADGGRGPMAKWLGFANRKVSVAGAIEIEPRVPVEDGHVVHFEFGLLKNGYAWNFPKQDGYSIGALMFKTRQRKGNDLVQPMTAYAEDFEVDATQVAKFGHPACIWNGNQRLHTQNAVLAGEAACVVDPLTAEGIRPSMFTGVKAAEAVDQALGGDAGALANYTQIVQDEIGREMKVATRIAKAFYLAPHFSYRTIMSQPSASLAMMQIFSGELKYADIVQKAMKKLSGGLLGVMTSQSHLQ